MRQLILKILYSNDWLYRTSRYIFILIIIVTSGVSIFNALEDIISSEIMRRDFLAVYLLPKAIAEGIDPYQSLDLLTEKLVGPLPDRAYPHPSPHPPTLGLLLLPLSLLNYHEARVVWFVVEIICLIASYILIFKWLHIKFNLKHFSLFALATFPLKPIQSELVHGNLHALILLLFAASYLSLTKDRHILAGVLLGFSVLLKQITAPMLLIFVILKDWKGLASSLVVIFSGYLLAACFLGIDTIIFYYTKALPHISELYLNVIENASLWTVGLRLFHGMNESQAYHFISLPIVYSKKLSIFLIYAIPIATMLVSYGLLYKMKSIKFQCAYLSALVAIVSPVTWSYYFIFVIIAITYILFSLHRNYYADSFSTCLTMTAFFLIIVPNGCPFLKYFHSPLPYYTSMLFLTPPIGVLILLWLVVKLDFQGEKELKMQLSDI